MGVFGQIFNKQTSDDKRNMETFKEIRNTPLDEIDIVHILKAIHSLPAKIVKNDGSIGKIKAGELKKGDNIVIDSGEIIPADGKILEGKTIVDESIIVPLSIANEFKRERKKVGDEVRAGGRNKKKPIKIEVTKTGGDMSWLALIRKLQPGKYAKKQTDSNIIYAYQLPTAFDDDKDLIELQEKVDWSKRIRAELNLDHYTVKIIEPGDWYSLKPLKEISEKSIGEKVLVDVVNLIDLHRAGYGLSNISGKEIVKLGSFLVFPKYQSVFFALPLHKE